MIRTDLLEQIPDDDPIYLAHVERCESEGMHPAVAAVQADVDIRYATGSENLRLSRPTVPGPLETRRQRDRAMDARRRGWAPADIATKAERRAG